MSRHASKLKVSVRCRIGNCEYAQRRVEVEGRAWRLAGRQALTCDVPYLRMGPPPIPLRFTFSSTLRAAMNRSIGFVFIGTVEFINITGR